MHACRSTLEDPTILSHLDGQLSLDEAQAAIRVATRQYARRQRTYFRNQLGGENVELRVTVTAPLWEPGVDLAQEAASWWDQVEAFLRRDGGA